MADSIENLSNFTNPEFFLDISILDGRRAHQLRSDSLSPPVDIVGYFP